MLLNMKILVAGICTFVFAIVFFWLLFPKILHSQVHKQVQLKKGSPTRELWGKFPFFLDFRIWLFNYTNPDEISNGAKPIVHDVGPFFYEEWQEKVDQIDHDEDDTIEYAFKNKWIFDPTKGLTGEEEIIIPHPFILVLAMTVIREKPAMVPIIGKAIDSIFKKPSSVFVKVKAREILFDGLPIDCTVTDFAGGAVCSLLRENADALQVDSPDHYRFSFFGARNDTPSKKKMRVYRGIKKLKNVGIVIEYDGMNNISKWNDSKCDEFRGTDGTIFHPFFKKGEDLVSFSGDICRSLPAYDDGTKGKVKGIKTRGYTAYIGDPEENPELKCYCETPDKCLGKGLMDLFKCVGAPLVMSHPHFYRADESYLQMVDGLHPSKEDHAIVLDFEPFTASPIAARKRIQFNIMVHPIEKLKLLKKFPDALLPLFWIEEGVVLPDFLTKQIKDGLKMVKIVKIVKWLVLFTGIGLMIAGGIMTYIASQKAEKMDAPQISRTEITTVADKNMLGMNSSLQVPTNLD